MYVRIQVVACEEHMQLAQGLTSMVVAQQVSGLGINNALRQWGQAMGAAVLECPVISVACQHACIQTTAVVYMKGYIRMPNVLDRMHEGAAAGSIESFWQVRSC